MVKICKKMLAVFLVVLMMLVSAPLEGLVGIDVSNLFETKVEAANIVEGTMQNIWWTLDKTTGVLIIGGAGAMPDFSVFTAPWYSYYRDIKSIIVSYGITYIGEYAFWELDHTTISIAGTVTGIGDRAFEYATSMKSIYLPSSCTWMGFCCFNYCWSLTDVYYDGNSSQFNNISKEYAGIGGFDDFIEATKHYNYKYEYHGEPKDFAEYSLKIVDSTTNHPIPNASVSFDGMNYISDAYGNVKLTALSSNKAKKITITCNTYKPTDTYLSMLDEYAQNIVKLSMTHSLIIDPLNAITDKFKVNGPSIEIGDKEVPLFTMEIGLDLNNLLDIDDPLSNGSSAYWDKANQTVEIIIGAKEGYSVTNDNDEWHKNFQKFKDYYKTFSAKSNYNDLMSKYNEIRDVLDVKNATAGFDVSGTIGGYLILDYSSGSFKVKEGGAVFQASAGVEYDFPFGTFFYATFGLTGDLDGKLTAKTTSTGTIGFSMNTDLKGTANIGVGAKLLAKELVGAEIGLEGSIIFGINVPGEKVEDVLSVSSQVAGYFKMYFFTKEIIDAKIKSRLYQLYPTVYEETDSPDLDIDRDYVIKSYESNFQDIFEEMDRSGAALRRRMRSIETETSIIEDYDVFANASPCIEKLDNGKMVAVWVKDDGTKSDANRTSLFYSIYTDGLWSVPIPLAYSEFGDYNPVMCSDGEKVYVVWQRMTKILEDNYTMQDGLENTSLVVSVFENNEFSEPTIISNSGIYQDSYHISAKVGKVIVAWTENTENDLSGETGDNLIKKRVFNDGSWSEIEESSLEANVVEYCTAFVDDDPSIVTIVDSDASYDTIDDWNVYVNGVQINSDAACNHSLSYQNDKIYWLSDKCLHFYKEGIDVNTGLTLSTYSNYFVQESDAGCDTGIDNVIYSEPHGYTTDLFVSYNQNGQMSTPVNLTRYKKHISNYDIVVDNDGTIWNFSCIDNINESTEDVFTTTDLICEPINSVTDIIICDYISYDIDSVYPGETGIFTIPVYNNGTKSIENVTINIVNSVSNVIFTTTSNTSILPGEQVELNVSVDLPENLSSTELTFEISADGDAEIERQSLILGNADLELKNCTLTDNIIIGTVVNNGYSSADNVSVSIFANRSETDLSVISMDTIAPGEEKEFTYTIPKEYLSIDKYYLSNRFSVFVETDSIENNYANNDSSVLYKAVTVSGITLDRTEVDLLVGTSSKLNATVYPNNAFDKNVIWISDSTDILTVNGDGTINALATGQAKVTAITVDGDFVAECTVNVVCNATEISSIKYADILFVEGEYKFEATLLPAETNETVIWSSDNTDIVEITEDGFVTPKQSGKVIITVCSSRGSVYQSFEVQVVEFSVDIENTNLYHIKDADDFVDLAKVVNDGYSFAGKIIKLDNDIDLTGVEWIPIGGSTTPFSGVFDGSNYTISGLNYVSTSNTYSGLFGYIKTGGVKDLTVEGSVSGISRVGMIAGCILDSAFYNCKTIGEVKRTGSGNYGYVGGLVGTALHSVIINCAAETDIAVDFSSSIYYASVGGIAGVASVSNAVPQCILNSYCRGDITVSGNRLYSAGSPYYVGGIVGYLKDDAVNNYYYGQIIDTDTDSIKEIGYAFGYVDPEFTSESDYNGIGKIIVSNNYYPEGQTAIASIDSGDYDMTEWTIGITKDSFSMLTGEGSLINKLNANTSAVEEIIVAHRDILSDSTWAELVERIDGDSFTVSSWKIGADNLPVNYEVECYEHIESDWITDIEATCTKEGSKHTYCLVCHETVATSTIDKAAHTFNQWNETKSATCTDDGSEISICTVCKTATETRIIDKLGHDFDDEWTVDKDATCTKEGSKSHHCSRCEEKSDVTAINKIAHDYTEVIIESTCTNDGSVTYTCTSCGDSYSEVITATGHVDNDNDKKCDNCDYSFDFNCDHICHKSGFIGFIWKIVRFLCKLFGMNPVCDCGVAHY